MENIVLVVVIGFLLVFTIVRELLHAKQTDRLTSKMLSRDMAEFANYDLGLKNIEANKTVNARAVGKPGIPV